MLPRIVITTGEPAGIGPEISIRSAWQLRSEVESVLVGDAAHLIKLARQIDPKMGCVVQPYSVFQNRERLLDGLNYLSIIDCPLARASQAGQLNVQNGRSVLNILDLAIEGTQAGWFDAIVTAPIQKSVINEAGIPFTGHTEYLAQQTGTPQVVMLLAGPSFRVALATTHVPLKDVSAAITFEHLLSTLNLIEQDLKIKWNIALPRILVTGLNPHAGEGGHLGREEIEVIIPVIQAAQAQGMAVSGPYSADTVFQPNYLKRADCILAMYHDQGLPVLKYASFGLAVNVTLGLPVIRTSVDHGTALDLAALGVGHADCGSMTEAIKLAALMVKIPD